ncbi:YccS family putative transporter [Zophobihabitans entericus]|uniref:TIGR01666 family membrane protein n=1 Tax=Zophobihabitans entericus TaxID=1635327 RepID=A0A6G9IBU2_9GAMM|nr:YccS family putative transporter [Zophobihabitans entericus]QIQ21302.1 TIGR01666 family membrane protein [Zophobihabitans entericus]
MTIAAFSLRNLFHSQNFFYSLRILISLIGSTFVPWYLGYTYLVIPTTLGVVAAALTDIDDRFTGRLVNLVLTLICFLIASFSVEILFPYPLLFLCGLLLSTLIFMLLGILGQRYAVIAFGSLLIAAYTMLGYEMYTNLYIQPLFLIIGALWYNLLTLIESILQPVKPAQESLSQCFRSLAHYLDSKAAMFDPDEDNGFKTQLIALTNANKQLVDKLNQTKYSLFNRIKSARGQASSRRMLNYYFVAQDIHERASSSHGQYQALSKQFRHSDILFRFARILNLQAEACSQVANSIHFKQTYHHNPLFVQYFSYLDEAIRQLDDNSCSNSLLRNSLANLFSNLQAIDVLLANINSEQQLSEQQEHNALINEQGNSFKEIISRIKQHLSPKSSLFRHAIRMSIVLGVGYLIIQATDLPHGYWIILTSLFVCQPNYSTTRYRLKLRVLGTIIGIILGLPLTYLLPNIEAQLVLIVLSGWLFFLFKNSQYAYATAFITLLVFFSFGLVGESSVSVATYRIIATIIGCIIAWLAVTFIWPDWKFRNLSQIIQRLCHNDCHYLALIGMQYQTGKTNDANYRLSRRKAHESDSELSSLISTMSSEPHADQHKIEQSFRLLTLNHTLLGYISTLGAHRGKTISEYALAIFDNVVVYTINTLNAYQKIDVEYTQIKHQLTDFIEQHPLKEHSDDILIMQQLLLILDILPETAELTSQLTNERMTH